MNTNIWPLKVTTKYINLHRNWSSTKHPKISILEQEEETYGVLLDLGYERLTLVCNRTEVCKAIVDKLTVLTDVELQYIRDIEFTSKYVPKEGDTRDWPELEEDETEQKTILRIKRTDSLQPKFVTVEVNHFFEETDVLMDTVK